MTVIIINPSTTERRLIIDVKASRKEYNEGIVKDVILIWKNYNGADATTKDSLLPKLVEMKTGKI